jgi:hypothetical protein
MKTKDKRVVNFKQMRQMNTEGEKNPGNVIYLP